MFSYRLTRLPYAVLMYVHGFWSTRRILEEIEVGLVLCSLPILLLFVIWPRLRDCDWPLWFGFLLITPLLGSLMGIALLFAPSKVIGRREDAVGVPPDDPEFKQIAGSKCGRCGSKIILASEGVVHEGAVLCADCSGEHARKVD